MDSHSYRIVAAELISLLEGARLEKIHCPAPGLQAFTLFAGGKKRRLLLRFERRSPLLLFTSLKPENPPSPPAAVMRLRKYCQGRRLARGAADFMRRQLAFSVAAAPGEPDCWLLLDLASGASVLPALPHDFGVSPVWPENELVDTMCDIPWKKRQIDGPWREWNVLTPFLRETLAALDRMEGRALMADLKSGGGELFLYADREGNPAVYSAWPLPNPLLERRNLAEEPLMPGKDADLVAFAPWQAPAGDLLPDFPALACATLVDEPKLCAALGDAARKQENAPLRKANKKAARLLDTLDAEERRLRGLLALREDAKRLQAELWRFAADAKAEVAEVVDSGGGSSRIALDPLLSVRENMQRMFKQSARGARGLVMLEERRKELRRSDERRDSAESAPGVLAPDCADRAILSDARELPFAAGQHAPQGVARFVSSDGFILLRGKNAKGNQTLLKLGKGHDYWMHAEDGPSAHLLVRRSHAAEAVPERTMMEAALLVAEKSWRRRDAKARIMVAHMKHVRPVKGGAPGQARVEQVLQSMVVDLAGDEEKAVSAATRTEGNEL